MPSTLAVGAGNEEAALLAGVIVFEPMQDAVLYPEHNQMSFYTWGDTNCCLPAGATEATLLGTLPNLQPGDVLIFQEVIGPQTGNPADADIRHRCAVRLTQVATQNGQGKPLVDPLFEDRTGEPIILRRAEADAGHRNSMVDRRCAAVSGLHLLELPRFRRRQQTLTDVSVVLGNVVWPIRVSPSRDSLAGTVPAATIFLPPNPARGSLQPDRPTPFPVRFRPAIPDSPSPRPFRCRWPAARSRQASCHLAASASST